MTQDQQHGSRCNDALSSGCLSRAVRAVFAAASSSSQPSAARSGGSGCLSTPRSSSAKSASAEAAPLHYQRKGSEQLKWFEQQARRAKRSALLVAGLQILSRFLGFFALTWASVVLLGGFAPYLRRCDFYLVSALALAESTRLFIIQIFSKLLSGVLFRERASPGDFKFKDEQPSKAMQLDLLGQCLGVVLAIGSLSSTVIRLAVRHSHHLSARKRPDDGFRNLPSSLSIFYTLVILNSGFAILSSLLRPFLRLSSYGCPWSRAQSPTRQDSPTCYHDAVYRTAMEAGLPEADQLQLVDFAFHKIASDFNRNIRPLLVWDLNKDMIEYLYNGKHGIAMACKYLKEGDLWKQVAAANLPGFWAAQKDIDKQVALFWGLRERMYGAWKDAESAFNSVECLAREWSATVIPMRRPPPCSPHPFLIDDPMARTNIVDSLVELLLKSIRPTLLFQTRAFEACCRDARVLGYLYEGHARELRNQRIDGESPLREESMSASLQDLVVLAEYPRGKRAAAAATRLGKLCMTLHDIVQGGKGRGIWSVTQIYAIKALLSVLLHDSPAEGLLPEAKFALQKAVDEGIEFRKDEQRQNVYFAKADVEAMEAVRCWLDLPAFEGWHLLRIEDLRAGKLSSPEVHDLIQRARRIAKPCAFQV